MPVWHTNKERVFKQLRLEDGAVLSRRSCREL